MMPVMVRYSIYYRKRCRSRLWGCSNPWTIRFIKPNILADFPIIDTIWFENISLVSRITPRSLISSTRSSSCHPIRKVNSIGCLLLLKDIALHFVKFKSNLFLTYHFCDLNRTAIYDKYYATRAVFFGALCYWWLDYATLKKSVENWLRSSGIQKIRSSLVPMQNFWSIGGRLDSAAVRRFRGHSTLSISLVFSITMKKAVYRGLKGFLTMWSS
jgi:hypothetical protein